MSLYNYIKRTYLKTSAFKYTDINLDILLLLLISKKTNLTSKKSTLDGLIDLANHIAKEVPLLVLFKNIHNYKSALELTSLNQTFIVKLLELKEENIDNLGFAYQMLIGKPQQQAFSAYYTPLELTKRLLTQYLDNKTVYDPFCGCGVVGIINQDSYGCDIDRYAVDIANINKYLTHGSNCKLFSEKDYFSSIGTHRPHDYIFTNIPFQKSTKQNEALLNGLANITNKKMLVIVPLGSINRMKNLTSGFQVVETLDVDTFQPFTKVATEAVLYTKP